MQFMTIFFNILRTHPELTIFLTLALGFMIGYIRIGNFKVGAVLGTLLAGVLIGQLNIQVPPVVKVIFFDLFLFATGYKVGPQFFRGLKKDALPQLILTFIICSVCLLTTIVISKILGYDVGTAAGMLAGAFTESTVIGTASEAIQRLPLPDADKMQLINNMPVAYAVTYLIGTISIIWFLSSIAPKMMRVNLQKAARDLGEKLSDKSETVPGMNSAFQEWTLRAFQVKSEPWTGKTIQEIEKSFPDARIVILRVRHEGKVADPVPDMTLDPGDIIAVTAKHTIMLERLTAIGPEISDIELLDFPMAFRDMILTSRQAVNKSLGELSGEYGQGVILHKLIREGQEIPFNPLTIVSRGDLLKVSGRLPDLERAAKGIGYLEPVSHATDMIFVGLGILLGGLIGLLSFSIGGISLTLTTSGGALVMGLVFGWLHSKSRRFGQIPEAALWIFDTVGLATFIGIIGLSAGPSFVSGLRQTGISLIFSGLVVALLPHIIGILAGRYILKMDPIILLGAHSGAGTTTAALKAIQDAAGSKLPVLGYTIPYALGNILLTAWGPIIVALMTGK
jgi:putative transport protein